MLSFSRLQIIIVILFFIFGWFLFTYRILDVPPGINGDEAAIGYNAALVASNGYDSNGRFLPLFTAIKDSKDWKQPVTFYSEVLTFRLFGPSYFNLRIVSVLFVLLSGGLIFLLVHELMGFKAAIVSLFIFTTTPIVMIQSHLALENIAPVPFITFWLWMIVKYSKNRRTPYLILALAVLGLSTFSYLGLRLVVPVLIILSFIFVYYLNLKSPKKAVRELLIPFLVIIPILVLFLIAKNQYPGSFLGQYRPYKIVSYQALLLPYISTFDPSFLFIKGDVVPYHSTGKQGMFLLATLPLFVLGVAKILQKRQPILIFVLLTFFLTPVLYGLASDIHRGSRLLSLIPPFVIICALGMMSLSHLRQKLWRFFSISIIITLIILNYADFLNDYWYEYPHRVKSEFAKSYHMVFDRARKIAEQEKLTVYIQSDFRIQNSIAVDFFEQAYFRNKLYIWQTGQSLPESSIVIVNFSPEMKSITSEKFKDTDFALLINKN